MNRHTRPAEPSHGRQDSPGIKVSIVVARARNRVIGRGNALPWHLPEDLRHFKATTIGHAILMGRRTYESIGRPLPGRRTIVISRDPAWSAPGCERAGSLAEALALAASPGADPSISAEEAFVVGGAQIYREAMPVAERIVMTEIDADFDGDVFLPDPDPAEWTETSRAPRVSASGLPFAIVELRRARGHRAG